MDIGKSLTRGQTVWFCPCRQQPMHSAADTAAARFTWIAWRGNSHFGPSPSCCKALSFSSRTGTSGEFMTRSSGRFQESRYRRVSGGRVSPQTSSYFSAETRVGKGAQEQAQLSGDSQRKLLLLNVLHMTARLELDNAQRMVITRTPCLAPETSGTACIDVEIKGVWSWCLQVIYTCAFSLLLLSLCIPDPKRYLETSSPFPLMTFCQLVEITLICCLRWQSP